MKLRSLIVIAVFGLFASSAYADHYTCTASNAAGIYDLSVDAGSATLVVDGMAHTAFGAGSFYTFEGSFAIGDAVFNSATLELPTDGSVHEIMFNATISDGAGGPEVTLTCSH